MADSQAAEEVVARALLAYDREKNGPAFLHIAWDERSDYGREEFLRPARAALEALRAAGLLSDAASSTD